MDHECSYRQQRDEARAAYGALEAHIKERFVPKFEAEQAKKSLEYYQTGLMVLEHKENVKLRAVAKAAKEFVGIQIHEGHVEKIYGCSNPLCQALAALEEGS